MKSLLHKNETLLAAGKGNAPGALSYLNARTGEIITVYQAIVTNTGPLFALACVVGNAALHSVYVPRAVLTGLRLEEKVLLIVDLTPASGPRAVAAWTGSSTMQPKPATLPAPRPHPAALPPQHRFERGTIASVAATGTYGRIITDSTGESVFLAGSQLAPGLALRPGLRVKFVRTFNPKGPAASQVLAA